MQPRSLYLLLVIAIILLLGACGEVTDRTGEREENGEVDAEKQIQPPQVTEEEVKLTLQYAGSIAEPEFTEQWIVPIQRKYPNFTLEMTNATYEEIVTSNMEVDLILIGSGGLPGLVNYKLQDPDISDLIKKHQFDIGAVEPSTLAPMRDLNGGKLFGLPLYDLRLVMYYNKELFEKFAVDYPKDGMTWEETIQLSKKMDRLEDGVQYRGFSAPLDVISRLNQFSIPLMNPSTNETTFSKDDRWKKWIEQVIPAYQTMPEKPSGYDWNGYFAFLGDKTYAMNIVFNSDYPRADTGMDWDVVTLPEMSGLPGVGAQSFPVYYVLSSMSKKRDEAFLAMAQMLSREEQLWRASTLASIPVLKDPEVKAAFGSEVPYFAGKNIGAFVAQKNADTVPILIHEKVYSELNKALVSIIKNTNDVNTALREAAERADQAIAAALSK